MNMLRQKLKLLLEVFIEEFKTSDNIQNEMLLVLLKRFIIYITGLAKSGYVNDSETTEEKFHMIRKFNLLLKRISELNIQLVFMLINSASHQRLYQTFLPSTITKLHHR